MSAASDALYVYLSLGLNHISLILQALADALEVSLYTHSLGVGTELIHGKALNHFGTFSLDKVHNYMQKGYRIPVLFNLSLRPFSW